MQSAPRDLIVIERLLEAVREIGILLIAFAPLDFAVSGVGARIYWPTLVGFLLVGFLLPAIGIAGEWRLRKWQDSSSH
jgi:hypothetical protein